MKRAMVPMKTFLAVLSAGVSLLLAAGASGASLDDVVFLRKVEAYEAAKGTTLVTQEGKRAPIQKGTILNVAGFAGEDAFVISRKDGRPNGFIKRTDIAPVNLNK
jgi:hypothetical protein